MDEYIKREDALDAVLFALVGTGYQSRAIYAIRDVQTADVAPRAEVAREILKEARQAVLSLVLANAMGENFDLEKRFAEIEKKYTEGE